MKLILITLVALIIGGMVACGEKAEQPLKQRQQQPPTLRPGANPTKGPYLTEKLVLGLMNQYAAERKPGSQCIRQHPLEADDTKEFRYEAGYWEVLVSGPQCDGVEEYRVKDSANGVITRIRPAWVPPTSLPPTKTPPPSNPSSNWLLEVERLRQEEKRKNQNSQGIPPCSDVGTPVYPCSRNITPGQIPVCSDVGTPVYPCSRNITPR